MGELKTSRRKFLAAGAASLVAASVAGAQRPTAAQALEMDGRGPRRGGGRPRKVIFMVSDGMSLGCVTLADQLSRLARNRDTHFWRLLNDKAVAHGFFETHSLSSLVTDSAAASSAWGSGVRVMNNAINTLPDGTKLTPILHLLHEAGFGTGLATTATITHATPAGFAASVPTRGMEQAIATQYLDIVDVALGGGWRHWDPARRDDEMDATEPYAKSGYRVLRLRDELLAAEKSGERLLGIFNDYHMPYTLDHMNSPELMKDKPTLAEMTRVALSHLHNNPQGFMLQVEGARVDHAAHANDGPALIWDQIAFDDAVEVALEYQRENPDTLIVVTSDHGNANPGLNGLTSSYDDSTAAFAKVLQAKRSSAEVRWTDLRALQDANRKVKAEDVGRLALDATGLPLTEDDIKHLTDAYNGDPIPEIFDQHKGWDGVWGKITGNHTGIGWTGTSHTEDLTVIAAKGPGQEAFNGLIKNTDFFEIATGMFGINHRNPQPTQISSAVAPESGYVRDVHWV